MNKKDATHRRLIEDLESAEEVNELLPTLMALNEWDAPKATEQETEQLLVRLRPLLPPQPEPRLEQLQTRLHWMAWLLRAQLRVVRNEIWLGSAFVMSLGVVVTLAADRAALPFVLIAPMVAAVGITFLYGPENNPALEIELATAVSPRLILLARMALLFGIDLILGIGGSIILSLIHPDILLGSLIMTWLAPMAFLSALAFFLSTISFEPLLGVMVSMILWGLQSLHQIKLGLPPPKFVPNLLDMNIQPWLWVWALLLGVTAVFLAGREERLINRVQQAGVSNQ
ncbi:MAG: hypothetical protein GY943_35590 [Chloroflexi bacterium]|nr:hypothetical protein [Chloroflexota bacterium]